MWKLGNRVVIVLVCILSGCAILYNIWGSVLGIIITLLLVIYASVSLLTNDNLQTPHALQLLEYIERAVQELDNLLQNISCHITTYIVHLIEIVKTFYRNYIITIMDGRRRNTYQLSTDTFINSNRNLDLNMVEGLTPIVKNRRRSYISGSENNSGIDSVNPRGYDGAKSLDKVTSTPLLHQWEKRKPRNGDMNYRDTDIIGDDHRTLTRPPSLYLNDHTMSRDEETMYSPRGSPWGTSISPKMRSRAAGVKTVQTVAGPLLTSTRYNIDPKIYTDVTSPGLSSRLTKYATEANMKLIHQSQYSTGQFPKVNLNASPTPIINSRSPRGRTSVTVRVAPPDTIKYSSSERQRMLSTICQTKNETPQSVAQVLNEISLKRHAPRDDIIVEIAKKQRTDGIHDDDSENYEEITQKRGRDDSKSEGEISVDNTSLRPTKRTKIPSCYDILNSLSSSTNVSSGVKRKADISRSGTPDIGKHFKSLDSIQRSRSLSISPQQNNIRKSPTDLIDDKLDDSVSSKNILISMSPKIISPYAHSLKKIIVDNERKLDGNNTSIKLTDRLFMRPEPQNIDKLKSLIQEHVNVGSKFTGDDGDEIKKSDVVIMRQTSMKARLQSMFDAISGKKSGQIDPNVVIQAEQVHNSTASPSSSTNQQSSSALITLNSSTFTTSINTSPISTSAIVPIIGKTKTNTTPGKHVTFLLPTATTASVNNESGSSTATESSIPLITSTSPQKTDELKNFQVKENKKIELPSQFVVSSAANSTSQPTFSLSSSSTASSIAPTTANINSAAISSTNFSSPIASSTLSNISQLFTPPSTNSPSAIAFGVPQSTIQSKTQSNLPTGFNIAPVNPLTVTATTTSFSFGTPTTISTTANNSQTNSTAVTQSTPMFAFQSTTASGTPTSSSTNLLVASKPTLPTLFTGTTSASSAATIAPIFSFGQSSNDPSTTQSTQNAPSQGTFSFGTPTVNLSTTTTTQSQVSMKPQTVTATTPSTFVFGENNTNTCGATFPTNIASVGKSIGAFGSNNSIAITTTGCTQATTSSSMFNFNAISTATKPTFAFGTSNNSQTTAANNPLPFGVPSQPSTPAFNSINHNSSLITTRAPSPPVFRKISTTIAQSTSAPVAGTMAFTFGTPNTQQSTFPSTTPSATNVNASIPQFNVTPKSTETSVFGMNSTTNMSNNVNASVATTTSASLFNNTNNSNIFGQSKIMSSTGAFGTSSSASPNFTTNTTNNFGITGQPLSFGTQQPMTTAGFGIAPSVISMSSSTFDTTNITTPAAISSTASSPPAFGTPNLSSTSSGFGTLKSIAQNIDTTPTDFNSLRHRLLFGAQTPNTATTFNTTVPSFASATLASPTTTATTTAPPAFGVATSLTSVFGTASGFGNANAPSPAFGSSAITNTAFNSGFGATNSTNPISPFSSQSSNTSTFGSSNTPIPSFGTPLSTNPTGSGSSAFSFGSTPTNQSQQPNSPFTFKGINTINNSNNSNNNNNNNNINNNSTSVATPFQFGAAAIPQQGGFNFTGGSPAPSFGGSSASGSTGGNSSGGGMFSIGSGSTAPRSRSTRPRRQQR